MSSQEKEIITKNPESGHSREWNTFTRGQEILSLLRTNKELSVNELTTRFGVSSVTIRTDLETLSKRGLLVRTHGGAVLPEDDSKARDITTTIHENRIVKEALARVAAQQVNDGDTVIIDSGSTMAILAEMLHGKKITVLTNSLPVLEELAKDEGIELIVIGGSFRRSVMASIGDLSAEVIRSINADILFMGSNSFDVRRGISCPNINEKTTKRLMISASKKVCLVSDHTKSDHSALVHVADWREISTFVTDRINLQHKNLLEAMGVRVQVVSC